MKSFVIGDKDFVIRRFDIQKDNVSELTELLHSAYKRLADMGLRFVATYQDDKETLNRINAGDCFVIEYNGKIISTICYYQERNGNCAWYNKEGVSYFGQFAVQPEYQKSGIGSKVMEFIEDYAKLKGMKELALDTSEKAAHLIDYYEKRGYRFVQHQQWDTTNYRSVVMSKEL